MIVNTPKVPYYAVIFTSVSTENQEGYAEIAKLMEELAHDHKGFIGMESAKNEIGITVSYWNDLSAIRAWKENSDHVIAQKKGKTWYKSFKIRIAKVERDYGFDN